MVQTPLCKDAKIAQLSNNVIMRQMNRSELPNRPRFSFSAAARTRRAGASRSSPHVFIFEIVEHRDRLVNVLWRDRRARYSLSS